MKLPAVECLWVYGRNNPTTSMIYFQRGQAKFNPGPLPTWKPEVPNDELHSFKAWDMWIAFVCGIIIGSGEDWAIIKNDPACFRMIKKSVFDIPEVRDRHRDFKEAHVLPIEDMQRCSELLRIEIGLSI
ncbi:MAG: hypothetical protein V4519_00905 [Patescibacteria group bacterium]